MSSTASWQREFAAASCLTVVVFALPAVYGQQLPSAKDLATVLEMLRSPDPVVRVSVACARNVFNANAAAAIPTLIGLLDDDEPVAPEVCREDHRRWWGEEQPITPGEAAARALVQIGIASLDSLIESLATSGAVARRNAAWALGRLDDRRAVTPLINSLKDVDPRVREQAAWALGAIDDARAVQPLIGALRDTVSGVRRQAAWSLGAIDDRNAVEGLVAALKDNDPRVREQAAWALGAIGDGRAGAGLTLALKDSEARVRQQAAWALGVIAD